MDLSRHALNSMLQAKTLYHTEKQGFGYPWLSKEIPETPTKTCWSRAQFQKGQPSGGSRGVSKVSMDTPFRQNPT